MAEGNPLGLGALAQPSGQGTPSDMPRAPQTQEEYVANRARAEKFVNRLSEPDGIRFLGTMGAWLSGGQGLGRAHLAASDQLARTMEMRREEQGRRDDRNLNRQRVGLEGQRVQLEGRRVTESERAGETARAESERRYGAGGLEERKVASDEAAQKALAGYYDKLGAAAGAKGSPKIKDLWETLLKNVPYPTGGTPEEIQQWEMQISRLAMTLGPSFGLEFHVPQKPSPVAAEPGRALPNQGQGGASIPTTPPRTVDEILGDDSQPSVSDTGVMGGRRGSGGGQPSRAQQFIDRMAGADPGNIAQGGRAGRSAPQRQSTEERPEGVAAGIQYDIAQADRRIARADTALRSRNPERIQQAFEELVSVVETGMRNLSEKQRRRIESSLKKLSAQGARRGG